MFKEIFYYLLVLFILMILFIIIINIIKDIINYYPNKIVEIDISKKKKMDDSDLLDYYLVNYGTEQVEIHVDEIKMWKRRKLSKIWNNKDKVNKLEARWKKNEMKAFKFVGVRTQTRYRQRNYQRCGYKVKIISNTFFISDEKIMDRIKFLKEHDYNVTYNNYTKTDQRKALTKELREKIKIRDNYTCQLCGKYMPDEVGLQIDHIVSIKDGGKSIPDNLRVLCSKCNGKKGSNSD